MQRAIMLVMAVGAVLGGLDRLIGGRFGLGKKFEEGRATLEELYDYAKKAGDPVAASGKQELCETILNIYAK